MYAYVGLLPWIFGFLVFTAYPIFASLYYSFTDFPVFGGASWSGLQNYHTMFFLDDLFWKSLRVTFVYSLVAVPSGVIVGYLVALLLNQKVKGLSIWRTMYFMPSIVPAKGKECGK
jgi:multiple sugar transport system permease protein